MSQPFGSPADEKTPPSTSSPLDSVLSEFWQLVTVNPTFLRYQLLRSAVLQWNGRTLRGRQRIVRYLRHKKCVDTLRGITFEHPTACAPFDQLETTNQPNRDGTKANSHTDMLELRAAAASIQRRDARERTQTATMTPASDNDDEWQAPNPEESYKDGFRTPPRASDVTVPPPLVRHQTLDTTAKGEKFSTSGDSSSTSCNTSEDDDESMSQQAQEKAIKKPRLFGETHSTSGIVSTATGAGAATSEPFGELQYLQATSSTNFSPASTGSLTPRCFYRKASVATSTLSDLPTLALSYRIHSTSRQPHFDRIVFRWSTSCAGRFAVRRKLFDTKTTGGQEGAAAETETTAAPASERPVSPQRANDNMELQSLPHSPSPAPRPIRYPNPPGTPVKRRRNIVTLQRPSSAMVGSTILPSSSCPSSSSSASSSTTSTSPYATVSYDYRRVRRKQLRTSAPPSAPSSAAVVSVANADDGPHIPYSFGQTGGTGSGANLIRLGNAPLPMVIHEEATRKLPALVTTATPTAPVRKPLRF